MLKKLLKLSVLALVIAPILGITVSKGLIFLGVGTTEPHPYIKISTLIFLWLIPVMGVIAWLTKWTSSWIVPFFATTISAVGGVVLSLFWLGGLRGGDDNGPVIGACVALLVMLSAVSLVYSVLAYLLVRSAQRQGERSA